MSLWIWFCGFAFSPHRFYMPDMFCSCCTRPKSSSNRCPTSSTCQHLTPKRSLYVVGEHHHLIIHSIMNCHLSVYMQRRKSRKTNTLVPLHHTVGGWIDEFNGWITTDFCKEGSVVYLHTDKALDSSPMVDSSCSCISLNSRILVTKTKNTLFGGRGGASHHTVFRPLRNLKHPL